MPGRGRPAARADPRADRRGDRVVTRRPRSPGDARRRGRARRRARATPRPGARSRWGAQIRVYDGEVESLSDAGGRGLGRAGVPRRPLGLRLRHRPERRRRRRAWRPPRARPPLVADPDEHGGPPRRERHDPGRRAAARPRWRGWSTERKVDLALEIERAARAREGVTQVENAVYSDARGQRGARQLARLQRRLLGDAGLGVRLRLRRRGRRPDDRLRRRPRPRPRRRSTPTRSAPRRRTGRSRWSAPASPRAGAAPSCSTPSWPHRSSASSAACSPPTRCSAAARCSPGARARRWPTRALRVVDDATDPEGPSSAPFDGEGSREPAHAADRGRPPARPSSTTPAPRARTAARPPPTPAAAPTAARRRWAPPTC